MTYLSALGGGGRSGSRGLLLSLFLGILSLRASISERLKNLQGVFCGPRNSTRYLITPRLHQSINVGLETARFSARILRASFSLISLDFMPNYSPEKMKVSSIKAKIKRANSILHLSSCIFHLYPLVCRIRDKGGNAMKNLLKLIWEELTGPINYAEYDAWEKGETGL